MNKSRGFIILALTPIIIYFGLFILYPLLYSFYASFHLWVPENPFTSKFIGISNYIKLFTTDPRFIKAFSNTMIYVALKTISVIIIGMILALILDNVRRFQRLYIYLIFLPVLCSASAIGLLFLYLYQPAFGLFNVILSGIGLQPQPFLSDARQALFCVIAADIWQTLGFSTLIIFTGLINMPKVFTEASRIDGANPFQTFFHVTLPLLADTILFVSVYTMIMAFQVFDFIFVMTSSGGGTGGAAGGPGVSTYVLSLLVYNEGLLRMQIDKGSAVGTVMFVIILIMSIIQFRILKPKWEY
jgi:multiple sugar transport system permease protein